MAACGRYAQALIWALGRSRAFLVMDHTVMRPSMNRAPLGARGGAQRAPPMMHAAPVNRAAPAARRKRAVR